MAAKCRAKNPNNCRVHGNPDTSDLKAQADQAASAGDLGAYLNARGELEKTKKVEPERVSLTEDKAFSSKFETAPLWRKKAVVSARQTTTVESLKTVLADGTVETSRDAVPAGHWIITNPGGEEYAISPEKFEKLYEDTDEEGRFRAKGVIRAYQNPTGHPVTIIAPWGEVQYGDENCWFAAGTDENMNPTDDRYIIGGQEFKDTYGPEK